MKKSLESTIRTVMEQQANAGVLYYGSDLARDTYAKDTPGQTPGVDHSPGQHQHKPNLALDGVPVPGGQLKKPNFEKDAGMGKVVKEGKGEKNCGCGKDPCETYGKQDDMKEMKDKCGEGEYWCNKDQKCKPIPDGMKVDKDGILVKESFKRYTVTHNKTGKKYKVTAMHDKSAAEKARAQHGGSASRYSGTSTSDFTVEEVVNEAGRWDQTSAGRAYRRLSPEEKARRAKAKMIQRRSQAMKGSNKSAKVGITKLRSVYKGSKHCLFRRQFIF